jgi:hypothetical protein
MIMAPDMKKVGTTFRTEWFQLEPDIYVSISEPGYRDNPQAAQANCDMMRTLAAGRKCGWIVVMSNHVAQDAETRQVYAENAPQDRMYGTAMIAANPLSRAISSFYLGISKPTVPLKVFGSIEDGLAWLQSIRPA